MPRKINESDYIGQKYNKLTIQYFDGKDKFGNRVIHCLCDCGNEKNMLLRDVRKGTSKSCGCLQKEVAKEQHMSHGFSRTRLYKLWHGMKQRCFNPKDPAYDIYGGKGITVCGEWKDDFLAFREWALSHGYKDGLTIERVDNDKGYGPDNCTWIPWNDQAKHTSRVRQIVLFGETKSFSDWLKDDRVSISDEGYYRRIKRGLSVEDALLTPSRNKKGRKKNNG